MRPSLNIASFAITALIISCSPPGKSGDVSNGDGATAPMPPAPVSPESPDGSDGSDTKTTTDTKTQSGADTATDTDSGTQTGTTTDTDTDTETDTDADTSTDTNTEVELSDDASVTSLAIPGVTLVPAFDPNVTSYTAVVTHRIASVDVNATTTDDGATVQVNAAGLLPDYALAVGSNTFTVEVKSEDQSATTTYTIDVTRARQYVYVTNVDDGAGADSLSLYSINPATGILEPQSPASITVGADPYDLAVSPDGRHLYVSNSLSDTVSMFSIDIATGALAPLASPTVAQGPTPYSIQFHPNGHFAWSANGDNNASGTIAQYSRDPVTGLLDNLTQATAGSNLNPWFLSVHPSGKYLYVTQFGSFGNPADDTVEQYQIDQVTGELSQMATFTVASKDKPWYILTHPSGKWVYAGNYGDASISQYDVDASTGQLTPMATATVASGTSPVGLAMDPQGRFLYVGNSGGNSVGMYKIDQTTGALSAIGGGTVALNDSPYGMMTDRTGAYLYVALSAGTEVGMLAIDQTTGALTALPTPNVAAGNRPRFFAIAD